MKRNYKPNHRAKTVLQCRILKARKTDVNGKWSRGKGKSTNKCKVYTT